MLPVVFRSIMIDAGESATAKHDLEWASSIASFATAV
jgi:hypothetical protein